MLFSAWGVSSREDYYHGCVRDFLDLVVAGSLWWMKGLGLVAGLPH